MSHFVAQLGGMTHFTVKYTVPDHKHTIMISDIKFGPLVTTQEPLENGLSCPFWPKKH